MGILDFWKRNTQEGVAPSAGSTAASVTQEEPWSDSARDDLEQALRDAIWGEVRLNRHEPDATLEMCREVHIEDQAPESEWASLLRFAESQIAVAAATHAKEKAQWPSETDCDRLDQAQEALRERGILFWQASPCCDTCSGSELPERVAFIEQRYPGFGESLKGYAFFIDQNLPEMLSESSQISVYLAYGWFVPRGTTVSDEGYRAQALEIAAEVCDCIRRQGLDVHWNGDFSQKIRVSLNWQRRELLQ